MPIPHNTIVLLDTNVWVSALINPNGFPARLRKAWAERRFLVVASEFLLQEIAEVLVRPRVRDKYGITDDEVATLIRLLRARAICVTPDGSLHVCRDADDNLILETALLGGAQYIVSRDEDITRDAALRTQLAERGIIPISVSQLLELLEID